MDPDEFEVEEEMEVEEVEEEEEWEEEVVEDDEGEEDPEEEEEQVVDDDKEAEDPEEEEQVVEEEEEEDPEEEEEVEEEDEGPEEEEEQVIEDVKEEEDPEEEELVVEEEEEEEEDPEEEEEVEEEEEDPEEEEDEQANQGLRESSNSPYKSSEFQKDVERDSESNRLDRRLDSCSSRTGEFKSCPELNSVDRGLKSTSPSDEQSTTLKDTCLSFDSSVKEPTLTEEKGTLESCVNEEDSERPTRNSQLKNSSAENNDEPRQDNIELVTLGNTGICNAAGEKISDSVPSTSGMGQRSNGACISGDRQSSIKSEDENCGTKSRNAGISNPAGEKVSDAVPRGAAMCQKSNGACSSGNSQSNIKLEDEKRGIKSRSRSFSTGGEINEPQQKRAGLVCQFFAKGWCIRGKSCRFLHVKDNLNNISQQQAGNNVAGSSEIRSSEERATLDNRVRGKSCQSREESEASLRLREERSLINSQTSQRIVFSKEDIGFIPSSKDMGRERLKQNVRNDGLENRSLAFNNGNPSIHRSSFVHGHRSSVSSNNSFHMKAFASGGQIQFENGNSGSARKKAKVSSDDWEPSEPFRPSFVIPPSIFPSFGTIYDLFLDGMDMQNLEDEEWDDDKDSFDSRNRYQEAAAEKNSEVHGGDMVATSVVEQNETTPKSRNFSKPVQNKDVLKRSRPTGGYDSWHRSNMSSNIKISRADRAADDVDGEVRSDGGTKVTRLFRTALIDTIKELLKPMWHGGRLSKATHNTIVKKASEKVISTAVQFRQVPTDAESVEQYLSVSQTKIVKLVEGYVERFRKS